MIDYNIEYHDVGTDSFFFKKQNDAFHPTVIFLANNRDSKSIRNYVESISAVYKNIGCSCVTLSFTLASSFLKLEENCEELRSDLLRVTSDIFGILSENQILHEPIFFHCVGDEGAFVYSRIAREFLTDYIAGVTLESFDLEIRPEANTNQSPVQQEKTSFVQKAFDYFVWRPYDAAKNFFTPEELSKTAKSVSSLRPKWPELFLCEAHEVSLARNICYARPASSYRQIISKFPSYSGFDQLAAPGLKYIFPKSYRHQLYSFIRRSCEESFNESEL